MLGLNDNAYAHGINLLHDDLGDLSGQSLLHLQAPRKNIDQPGQFAQSDHLSGWDIRDMAASEEWQQMVLAQAEDLNVLHDHHFVIRDREKRSIQYLIDILPVAAGQVSHGLRHPMRRPQQAFPAGVLAELANHRAHGLFEHIRGRGAFLFVQELQFIGFHRFSAFRSAPAPEYSKELEFVSSRRTRSNRAEPGWPLAFNVACSKL